MNLTTNCVVQLCNVPPLGGGHYTLHCSQALHTWLTHFPQIRKRPNCVIGVSLWERVTHLAMGRGLHTSWMSTRNLQGTPQRPAPYLGSAG